MVRQKQFDKFSASELFCPKCGGLQPVRERLLLILPHAEIYEYRCTRCATSLGSREVKETAAAAVIAPAGAVQHTPLHQKPQQR